MRVEAIALSGFQHGDIHAVRGELVKHRDGQLITDALAADLERAGLVRIQVTPGAGNAAANKAAANDAAAGKAAGDGAGTPSSASPAAPALPTPTAKTLHVSKPGAVKTRKRGT
ncbi:MAG: hypothetical protein ABI790_02365 [Betaproteobacteria bacterium]